MVMRYFVYQSETKKEALQRKTLQDNSSYISRPRTARSSKDVNYANSSCQEDIDYALNIIQIYSILNFENNQILNSQTGTYCYWFARVIWGWTNQVCIHIYIFVSTPIWSNLRINFTLFTLRTCSSNSQQVCNRIRA